MFHSEKSEIANFRPEYASRADFCRALEAELKSLYLLAFLLTANHKRAEECFAAMVDEAFRQETVFKDWVRPWIKSCLIKQAIAMVAPVSASRSEMRDTWRAESNGSGGDDEINAVTQLSPMERFVFVMSVLEHYSRRECSVLLGCGANDVARAQMRALRQLPEADNFFLPIKTSPANSLSVAAAAD